MASLVRVRNLSKDKTLSGAYDGVPYVIPPGESVLLDEECAIKDWGDWNARNLGREEKLRFREQEYKRLLGLYGVMPGVRIPTGEFNEDGIPLEVPSEKLRDERLPKVEIERMDGSKVIGVLEDPEGSDLPVEGSSNEEKDRAITSMQEEIDKLRAGLETLLEQQAAEVPTDSPETAERPKGKRAKAVASQVSGIED